jgi:hypothetical protein
MPAAVARRLVTAIMPAGRGLPLAEKLVTVQGIISVSHHHARGVGNRQSRARRHLYADEKDVVLALVEAARADEVFAFMYREGSIGEPHAGIIFMERVLRGHPMLPPEDPPREVGAERN